MGIRGGYKKQNVKNELTDCIFPSYQVILDTKKNVSPLGVYFDPPLEPLKLVNPLYKARIIFFKISLVSTLNFCQGRFFPWMLGTIHVCCQHIKAKSDPSPIPPCQRMSPFGCPLPPCQFLTPSLTIYYFGMLITNLDPISMCPKIFEIFV